MIKRAFVVKRPYGVIGSLVYLNLRLLACGADVAVWQKMGVRNIMFRP